MFQREQIKRLELRPLVKETKNVIVKKGPVKITKRVVKPDGETVETVTEKAPSSTEVSVKKEETPISDLASKNRYLAGITYDVYSKRIRIGHLGYSINNRVDLAFGYDFIDNRPLVTLMLRF